MEQSGEETNWEFQGKVVSGNWSETSKHTSQTNCELGRTKEKRCQQKDIVEDVQTRLISNLYLWNECIVETPR